MNTKRKSLLLFTAAAVCVGALSAAPAGATSKEHLIGQAEYYVREFEKEVER